MEIKGWGWLFPKSSPAYRASMWMLGVIESPQFEIFMGSVIIANFVQLVLQTTFVEETNSVFVGIMSAVEIILLTSFSCEAAMKLLALGPFYFRYVSNIIDLGLTILSFFTAVTDSRFSIRPTVVRMIRIVRLVRVLRLGRNQMTLVATFTRSFGPLAFMGVYVVMFVYSFAAVGVMCFSCRYLPESYTAAHYSNIPAAMLANFQLLTTSNWHGLMYAVMDATTPWAAVYFVLFQLLMTFILLNAIIALIIEAFHLETYARDAASAGASERLDPERLERFNAHASFEVKREKGERGE